MDIETQSKGFQAHRDARRYVIIEDYVELISDLLEEGGEARQVDIAERLGVSQPTVAKVLVRLVDEGLVIRRPYRGVFLTEEGKKIAASSRKRHHIVKDFLTALGVSEETALIDAEAIEHYVSEESLEAFQKAIRLGLASFVRYKKIP